MTIQTVLGPVEDSAIGPTMMHEDTFFDLEASPGDYNAIVSDEDMLVAELRVYREAGGSAIADLTPSHLGRNPEGMARISKRSGAHIVMGAGWHRREFHPPEIAATSTNDLADGLIREFREGVGDTGIRPGILGELGTGRGRVLSPGEERAFRARSSAARGRLQHQHPHHALRRARLRADRRAARGGRAGRAHRDRAHRRIRRRQ